MARNSTEKSGRPTGKKRAASSTRNQWRSAESRAAHKRRKALFLSNLPKSISESDEPSPLSGLRLRSQAGQIDRAVLDGANTVAKAHEAMKRLGYDYLPRIRNHFRFLVERGFLVKNDDGTYKVAKQTLSDVVEADYVRAGEGAPRQPDPFLRRQVEDAAVEETRRHFTEKGYIVDSFEKDNVGWDLEAKKGRILLRLEVKGLSGSEICVELTPNEYRKMEQHRDSYQICIVTSALSDPKLLVFAFSNVLQCWADQDGDHQLEIEEIRAARCRAVRA
jgi:hypothetical protein